MTQPVAGTTRAAIEVRALARTRSLQSLAADFGVSHETVRVVIRVVEVADEGRGG